jgi:hypothetical protein
MPPGKCASLLLSRCFPELLQPHSVSLKRCVLHLRCLLSASASRLRALKATTPTSAPTIATCEHLQLRTRAPDANPRRLEPRTPVQPRQIQEGPVRLAHQVRVHRAHRARVHRAHRVHRVHRAHRHALRWAATHATIAAARKNRQAVFNTCKRSTTAHVTCAPTIVTTTAEVPPKTGYATHAETMRTSVSMKLTRHARQQAARTICRAC